MTEPVADARAQLQAALGDAYIELYFISPAWLRIDPTWNPLRGDPRFERLTNP